LPPGLVDRFPFSPSTVLALPNDRVLRDPSKCLKYAFADGRVSVLIYVYERVTELPLNVVRNGFLIHEPFTLDFLEHPLSYGVVRHSCAFRI